MERTHYTARQILEIRGSFIYFIMIFVAAALAVTFQMLAQVNFRAMVGPIVIGIITSSLAYIIYTRKKKLKKTTLLSWAVAIFSVTLPIMAKYNYARSMDWQYSTESYHIFTIAVFFLIALQFLYNRRMFIFFFFFVFINWIVFLFIADHQGVTMYFLSIADGRPVHNFIILREVYFMALLMAISYISYRNIPIIHEYDRRTVDQMAIIEKQSAVQKEMAIDIREKMDILFEQVEAQNKVVADFNAQMQSQASTFEEISATLEELLGSSESISGTASAQIEENEKMEEIIDEFKNIQAETKHHLDSSLEGINLVVDKTTLGKKQLDDVERFISDINTQSLKIFDTVSIIIDIADKINLLSLNASIEAARAGEHGRGFAVVADEIGKLAVQTTDSIKEIESVLASNKHTTSQGVEVIQSAATIIKDMIEHMEESSNKIKILKESIFLEEKYTSHVIEQTVKNLNLAKNIGAGTDEQKLAIESTTQAVNHINETIADMIKGVNEIAESSQLIFFNARELLTKAEKASV